MRERCKPPTAGSWRAGMIAIVAAIALVGGCMTPSPHTVSRNYGRRGDVPVDPPRPPAAAPADDDCAAGGRLFQLYCGSCHNARPLGERPFSNYHVALTHMRDQAYLTGKEYRQILYFLRRWHDVGPPTPPVEPSPKRLVFSQPLSELRPESPAGVPAAAPPPVGSGPWQPPATGATGESTRPQPGAARGSSALPPLPELPSPSR